MSSNNTRKQVVNVFLIFLCFVALIGFLEVYLKVDEEKEMVHELNTSEDNANKGYYLTGRFQRDGISYEVYSERVIAGSDSYSTYEQVVESETELFENLADTYEVKTSTEYEDDLFTTIVGDWETEGIKKFVGILHRKISAGYITYYVEICCEETVSYDKFKDTTNSLFEDIIETIK